MWANWHLLGRPAVLWADLTPCLAPGEAFSRIFVSDHYNRKHYIGRIRTGPLCSPSLPRPRPQAFSRVFESDDASADALERAFEARTQAYGAAGD